MAIEFVCSNPECRKHLKVADEKAGKKVKYPKFKTVCIAPVSDDELDTKASGFEATMVADGSRFRGSRFGNRTARF
jgi:hypothetical protein